MGPLFQLAIIIILYVVVASVSGFVLFTVFRFSLAAYGGDKKFASRAFWFPWKVAPYFLLALIANIVVCEYVRGVDAPLTDYWTIPVGQDAAIGAIDTSNWNLWPSRGGGEVVVANILKFVETDNAVLGEAESGLFAYWLPPEGRLEHPSQEQLTAYLSTAGLSEADLVAPDAYYYDSRRLGDLLTLLVVFSFPIYWFGRLVWGAVQSAKLQRDSADVSAI
jgi:energy-coupling factor transporter transmembrane protein EcfT